MLLGAVWGVAVNFISPKERPQSSSPLHKAAVQRRRLPPISGGLFILFIYLPRSDADWGVANELCRCEKVASSGGGARHWPASFGVRITSQPAG